MPVHDIPGREIAERLAFIQQHPDDPGLSPAEIAAAHHISLRLLHNLFQEQGETCGGVDPGTAPVGSASSRSTASCRVSGTATSAPGSCAGLRRS